MKFSAVTDADLRRATRTRNKPDLPLEEELSPEELVEFYNRIGKLDAHRWQRQHGKEFLKYQNEVAKATEERIEKRKRKEDKRASISTGIPTLETRQEMLEKDEEWEDPKAFEHTWESFEIPGVGPICSDRRQFAQWLCADPLKIRWDALSDSLFVFDDEGRRHVTPQLCKIVNECRTQVFPEQAWNQKIAEMEPSTLGGVAYGRPMPYRDPTLPQHEFSGLGFQPRPGAANENEILQWMFAAEQHALPNRVTRCRYSGKSLIEKGPRGWWISPNWQGMSLQMARQAVTYAAIVAGVAEGKLLGKAPPVVHELAKDGDAWCALAVATKHPQFYQVARFLIMLRDKLYFDLEDPEVRANMRAWDRLAAQAAKEEGHE